MLGMEVNIVSFPDDNDLVINVPNHEIWICILRPPISMPLVSDRACRKEPRSTCPSPRWLGGVGRLFQPTVFGFLVDIF